MNPKQTIYLQGMELKEENISISFDFVHGKHNLDNPAGWVT